MKNHLYYIQEMVETRRELETLKKLKEQCFRVFSTDTGVTMEFIKNTINNEWPKLMIAAHSQSLNIQRVQDIVPYYYKLVEGLINRKEFKEALAPTIESVEQACSSLENKLKEAEEQFSKDYDSFFHCDSREHKKNHSKYIFYVLSQPETKKIIMNFLES